MPVQVRGCEAIPPLLRYVLVVGNHLNKGAARLSGAAGFKIADLAKLKDVKTADSKASLLDFVVDFVITQQPQHIAFTEDLQAINAAKSISVPDARSSLAAVAKDMGMLKSQLTMAEKVPAPLPMTERLPGPVW